MICLNELFQEEKIEVKYIYPIDLFALNKCKYYLTAILLPIQDLSESTSQEQL